MTRHGHPLDDDGYLRNVAEPRTIHPAYTQGVAAAVAEFRRIAPPHDTLLLCGSVANGTARPGTSDMDLVWGTDSPPESARPRTLADVIAAVCPSGTFVDVSTVRPLEISDLAHGRAELVVSLATSRVVLAGTPVRVAACRPGKQLASALYPEGVARLANMLQTRRRGDSFAPYAGKNQPRRFWLTWLARDLIRCAGAAVMALDGRYSRDLSTCIGLVADIDRWTAEQLSIGLKWAVQAPDDPQRILPWAASCVGRVSVLWRATQGHG